MRVASTSLGTHTTTTMLAARPCNQAVRRGVVVGTPEITPRHTHVPPAGPAALWRRWHAEGVVVDGRDVDEEGVLARRAGGLVVQVPSKRDGEGREGCVRGVGKVWVAKGMVAAGRGVWRSPVGVGGGEQVDGHAVAVGGGAQR